MKNKITGVSVLIMLLGLVGPTQAAVFDFGAMGNSNPTDPSLDFGELIDPITIDMITLNVTASHTQVPSVPYLDRMAFNSKNAGLGACSSGIDADSQCIVRSDDNVTTNEMLHLQFNGPVEITDLAFKDRKHDVVFPTDTSHNTGPIPMINVALDGGSLTAYAIADLLGGIAGSAEHVDFGFNNRDFYIEKMTVTAVPLPAALPLMFTALASLGLIGWRRGRNNGAATPA